MNATAAAIDAQTKAPMEMRCHQGLTLADLATHLLNKWRKELVSTLPPQLATKGAVPPQPGFATLVGRGRRRCVRNGDLSAACLVFIVSA